MSLLDWINPFNKIIDIVDQYVPDKDKAAELKFKLSKGAQDLRIVELQTKTVPWMDGIHKLSRTIGSFAGYGLCAYMISKGITDPIALASCFAPGGIYNYVKGKGK